uniref:alcohol dehydrogenase n=1 Tax=Salix viminalis TaxID=40686 RepID=A0A6N2LPK6_SALVM
MSSTAGQVIRCKAAVAWEAGKPLVMEEVDVAPPQAMEVRVKILFTSLCHTDVYFWEAKGQTPLFPRIFGHEAGGIVESVGEGVTDLEPGDHVLPVFTGECKECRHCKSEESNMCDLLRINTDRGVMLNDGKSRFSIRGQPIYHFVGTSTFSEYTVVHVGCLAKINPAAPLDKVCVLSCGISTGLGATLNVAKPKKGSSVAIFGLGAVGLAAAEGARISGASRIIGVDLNANRFEEAKKFGVTEFVNPKDHDKPVHEVIAEMTNGGVDRSVECTGSVSAMISAFECVHDGWGVAVLVGVPNKDDAFKTHPMNVLNERTLKGTFFGNYKPRSDIPSVVEKYMNKELELEKFITHEVPFAEINKAFEYMLSGAGLSCRGMEAGKPLVIEEVEVAPPQAMEVRLKILFTSLCHTDVYFWKPRSNPMFLEYLAMKQEGMWWMIAGSLWYLSLIFCDLGFQDCGECWEGVTDLEPGDHVLPVFTGECKECRHCKSEESNMCDLLRINTDRGVMLNDGKSRFSVRGSPFTILLHLNLQRVHCGSCWLCRQDQSAAPLDIVCVLSCLGATLNVQNQRICRIRSCRPCSAVVLKRIVALFFPRQPLKGLDCWCFKNHRVDLNSNRFEEAEFGVTEFVTEVMTSCTRGHDDIVIDRSVEVYREHNAMFLHLNAS